MAQCCWRTVVVSIFAGVGETIGFVRAGLIVDEEDDDDDDDALQAQTAVAGVDVSIWNSPSRMPSSFLYLLLPLRIEALFLPKRIDHQCKKGN